MGAAGRDFHNFNLCFRDNPVYQVVAFTAAQIPFIHNRTYPGELAGVLYPNGIPIYREERLASLIKEYKIDEVFFSYSDVSHEYIMHKASLVTSLGSHFILLGAEKTMLKANRPVISVCAVRTGCGKSGVTRSICKILMQKGKKPVAIRHPMPYGDFIKQRVQRFAAQADLITCNCTIEEREEFEPLIDAGVTVYAGVDYADILKQAEKEADIIVWDGGNNDLPFIKPDLEIVIVDPHRAGHELLYYHGEINFRRADVLIINKMDTANISAVDVITKNIKEVNPETVVIYAKSVIKATNADCIQGKNVLVVEDGPSLTHGGMAFGAGIVAAKMFHAAEIVNPRPYAAGSIKNIFSSYPHIKNLIPAMGYASQQIKDLEDTINNTPCDLVLIATPVDLGRIIKIDKPTVRVSYEIEEIGKPTIADIVERFLAQQSAS
ncbi:MAG: GTPase [Deltaproteobacteria bacterium]|nr:GTPase [Deltaproteobacteria bacterium]